MEPLLPPRRRIARCARAFRRRFPGRRGLVLTVAFATGTSALFALAVYLLLWALTGQSYLADPVAVAMPVVTPLVVAPPTFAMLFALTDELEHEVRRRREAEDELRALAALDDLTGLPNRRAFLGLLDDELRRSGRCVVAMLDLDHFKAVNDEHGHATGDRVLRSVARAMAGALAGHGHVGRLGGEEFAIVLGTNESSEALLDAVRHAARDAGAGVVTTISIGATRAVAGDTVDEVLLRADRALYHAKASGRDRVVFDDAFTWLR